MKFKRSDEDRFGDANVLAQVSEGGKWVVFVELTVTGSFRVCVGTMPEKWGYVARRYCCGPYPITARLVFGAVVQALGPLNEDLVSEGDVEGVLPRHTVEGGRELRPINTDPLCFLQLLALAGVAPDAAKSVWDAVVENEAPVEGLSPFGL